MNRRVLYLIGALLALAFALPASAQSRDFQTLRPGKLDTLRQTIPVNIVFVGYDAFDTKAVREGLPHSYRPIVRLQRIYHAAERNMGLRYDFSYRVVNANAAFDDQFFAHLTHTGRPGPLTEFQRQYNEQQHNRLDVTGPVLYIDAPSTERWLANHSQSALGLDIAHSYTIFFVNWYGRPGFRFHVYTKTDAPEPDTGHNFGTEDSRALVAWGGSSSRTWFYDLSAGPDSLSFSWNVDDADINDDTVPDYRIPPIWEYAPGGYRDPARLIGDLSKVVRYVAIDELFTPSPLADPLITAPGPGGRRVVHVSMLEDEPASSGLGYLNAQFIRRTLRDFQPYYTWRVDVADVAPIDPGAQRALRIWNGLLEADDCWNNYRGPFDELFCYFNDHTAQYVPAYAPNDYVAKVFAYNTTAENLDGSFPAGFVTTNLVDGTQKHVIVIESPATHESGIGFSAVIAHELGHHYGFAHPFGGYDFEQDRLYNQLGDMFFIYIGDEANSLMAVSNLTISFGQFDRDNMYRWETAGYLNRSNELLAAILARPGADRFADRLHEADQQAGQARRAFAQWRYLDAASSAYRAYDIVAGVAQRLGISVVASS
jgi:hypothetical protein